MFRLILFDIDGTLISTGGAGMKAFAQASASEFSLPNGTANLKFSGRTDPSIVREFFTAHKLPPTEDNFRRFFDAYLSWLDHFLEQQKGHVCPGIPALIERLRQVSPAPLLGLLTGNIRRGAEKKLRHYRLWDVFHPEVSVFGSDDEDRNRLSILAREKANALLHADLRGDDIWIIGDTPLDIECARHIGARSLALATGIYSVEELRIYEPTLWRNDATEVSLSDLFPAS